MGRLKWAVLILSPLIPSCTTTFIEFRGECVLQRWALASFTLRQRQLCDLPPPSEDVGFDPETDEIKDREAMDVNPFPDLLDRDNNADTIDPNLLEKRMKYDPDAPIETVDGPKDGK